MNTEPSLSARKEASPRNVACKDCYSDDVVKDGFVKGTQIYKCMECGKRFSHPEREWKAKHDSAVYRFIHLQHGNGRSLRDIAHAVESLFGIKFSHVAVGHYLRKHPMMLFQKVQPGVYAYVWCPFEDCYQPEIVDSHGKQLEGYYELSLELLRKAEPIYYFDKNLGRFVKKRRDEWQ